MPIVGISVNSDTPKSLRLADNIFRACSLDSIYLKIEQIALFVFGSSKARTTIGGGSILMISDFINQIKVEIKDRV